MNRRHATRVPRSAHVVHTLKKGARFPWRPQTDQQFESAYLVAASTGLAAVFATALLVRLCLTFLAVGFAVVAESVVIAAGATAVAAAGAGAGLAAATGACAKDATARPDRTVAAIKDLIFNMVWYSLIHNSRISSDRLERPNLFAGLATTTRGFSFELTAFTFVYRASAIRSRAQRHMEYSRPAAMRMMEPFEFVVADKPASRKPAPLPSSKYSRKPSYFQSTALDWLDCPA